jgi:hypothetical protein
MKEAFEMVQPWSEFRRCVSAQLDGRNVRLFIYGRSTAFQYSLCTYRITNKQTPWTQSARQHYRPSDRRLSANLVPAFGDRRCRAVSVTDPYGHILGFLDQSRYFFFQVAPQLYSRGWVDPVPDPLLLRKSGSAGNRTRTSGAVARNSDH